MILVISASACKYCSGFTVSEKTYSLQMSQIKNAEFRGHGKWKACQQFITDRRYLIKNNSFKKSVLIVAGEVLLVRGCREICSVGANALHRQSRRKQKEKQQSEHHGQGWRRRSRCSTEEKVFPAALGRTHTRAHVHCSLW